MHARDGLLLFAVCAFSTSAFAVNAWKVSPRTKAVTGSDEIPFETISDEEYRFQLDGIPCVVTKTQFVKLDTTLHERRELICGIANDTFASIALGCDSSATDWEMNQLVLEVKGKRYHSSLQCGPKPLPKK